MVLAFKELTKQRYWHVSKFSVPRQGKREASPRNRSGTWERVVSVVSRHPSCFYKWTRSVAGSQGPGKALKAEESRCQETRMVQLGADGMLESGSTRDKAI